MNISCFLKQLDNFKFAGCIPEYAFYKTCNVYIWLDRVFVPCQYADIMPSIWSYSRNGILSIAIIFTGIKIYFLRPLSEVWQTILC